MLASPMHAPALFESARLAFRRFVHDDWPAMHEHYSDIECTRFTFGRALSEAESWRAMASIEGHWSLRGYGPYALVEKSTGTVVGTAGLWYPNDWPEPEIKWALLRRHWNRGFASEAVRTIQPLATASLNGNAPISFINAANALSIRLALAVGATLERETEFRGAKWQVYRHPKGNAA